MVRSRCVKQRMALTFQGYRVQAYTMYIKRELIPSFPTPSLIAIVIRAINSFLPASFLTPKAEGRASAEGKADKGRRERR